MKNLQELSIQEMRVYEGGSTPKSVWLWLGEQIIENWDDIKQGFSDGWNGTYNPPKK